MTTRTFCSTCGTPIDPARQFCARCGIFTGEWSWAPGDALVCASCGAPNAPGRTECGRCFRDPRTGLDHHHATCGLVHEFERQHAPGSVAAAQVPTPLPAGACDVCGRVNARGEPFCGNCGRFLEWGGSVASLAPAAEPTEESR